MLPVMDDRHQQMFNYAQYVAGICLSEKFSTLKKELEKIYLRSEDENSTLMAFQDALYAIIAEEEMEFFTPEQIRARG